jgi:hypothetical protein
MPRFVAVYTMKPEDLAAFRAHPKSEQEAIRRCCSLAEGMQAGGTDTASAGNCKAGCRSQSWMAPEMIGAIARSASLARPEPLPKLKRTEESFPLIEVEGGQDRAVPLGLKRFQRRLAWTDQGCDLCRRSRSPV